MTIYNIKKNKYLLYIYIEQFDVCYNLHIFTYVCLRWIILTCAFIMKIDISREVIALHDNNLLM